MVIGPAVRSAGEASAAAARQRQQRQQSRRRPQRQQRQRPREIHEPGRHVTVVFRFLSTRVSFILCLLNRNTLRYYHSNYIIIYQSEFFSSYLLKGVWAWGTAVHPTRGCGCAPRALMPPVTHCCGFSGKKPAAVGG